MNVIMVGGALILLIVGGTWFASSLTYFLAPQNRREREMDDEDQIAYLKEYAKKYNKKA